MIFVFHWAILFLASLLATVIIIAVKFLRNRNKQQYELHSTTNQTENEQPIAKRKQGMFWSLAFIILLYLFTFASIAVDEEMYKCNESAIRTYEEASQCHIYWKRGDETLLCKGEICAKIPSWQLDECQKYDSTQPPKEPSKTGSFWDAVKHTLLFQ